MAVDKDFVVKKGLQVGAGVSINGTANVAGQINATANVIGTQFISTIAVGTAPFVVASNTTVANLSAGFVGGAPLSAIALLGGTTAAFTANVTTPRITVVGAANVGGVLTVTANVVVGNNSITDPVLVRYKEFVSNEGTVSTNTYVIDLNKSNIFKITMANNITFSLANVAAAGNSHSATLILVQDATGSRTASWNSAFKWSNQSIPTLSTGIGAIDVVTMFSIDGGTSVYATLSMANVS